MVERIRYRILSGWSRLVSRHPGYVLFVAVAVAVASAAISAAHLGFESDRNRLIADDIAWNRWFIDWRDNFVGKHDLTVVVDTAADGVMASKHRQRAEAVVGELARRLQADRRHVSRVVWGFDANEAAPHAIRTLGEEAFAVRVSQIEQSQLLLGSRSPTELLGRIEAMFKAPASLVAAGNASEATGRLAALINGFHAVVTADGDAVPSLAEWVEGAANDQQNWQFLASQPDGRLLFLRVTPMLESDAINAQHRAMQGIRGHLAAVATRYPGVEMGLTGLEAVEADETTAATRDSALASVVAFIVIAALLVTAFHSWRMPLLVLAALVIGVTWTFGFVTLAIGYLQVVSVVFFVILLGLGIGYGIHLASRFELIRHRYPDGPEGFEMALCNSLTVAGPGIVTGAVTTAAAFVTTIFTDFKGVGEMGLIAAGGIMLCLLSMVSVFPALLRLAKPGHKHFRPMESRWFHFFQERWVMPFVCHPRITVLIAVVLGVASLLAAVGMRFNYNLMDLQPRGAESVRWEKRIATLGGRSVYSAVCIVEDLAAARDLVGALRQLDTVDDVGGVGLLFPPDEPAKQDRLAAVRRRLGADLASALAGGSVEVAVGREAAQSLVEQLRACRRTMAPIANLARFSPRIGEQIQDASTAVDRLATTLEGFSADQRQERIGRLQSAFAAWRLATAQRINAALARRPLGFDDLPVDVMRPYRDAAGRYALEIYPDTRAADYQSPLDPDFLPRFVGEIRQTIDRLFKPVAATAPAMTRGIYEAIEADEPDPRSRPILTGPMIQFYESGQLVLHAYQAAGLVALAVVFLLVLFDLKRPIDALLTLLPVSIGFAVTFGVMRLFGMSVNPANIIVLPLMFGIGVDAGVHVMHRYRQDDVTRPLGLTDGTGKGITITSLTAVIGFAALMLASHRGLWGLGMVMALGIALTMVACLTVMPACLELLRRRSADHGTG